MSDLLIATLTSGRSIRRFNQILYERKMQRYKRGVIQSSLSRLSKRGYVKKSDQGWSATERGQKHLKRTRLFEYIESPFGKNAGAGTIISFDIPERDRVKRNWLRNQIKIFGYKMLQQSLWVGPGPLPKDFISRLEDMGIRKNVKTFKIRKAN